MNIITKLPGPLLVFLGACSLSFGGLIVKSFEGSTLWQILFWRSLFFSLTVLAFLVISYRKKTFKANLTSKQKFSFFYGNLLTKYLKFIIKKSLINKQKKMQDFLVHTLESRLDIFLYRSGLFPSIFEAKQWVNHKKIKVNKTIVNNNNYVLKSGDFIEIPTNLKYKKIMLLPYSHIDNNLPILVFLRKPRINEIKYPFKFNSNFLFEYLNKN